VRWSPEEYRIREMRLMARLLTRWIIITWKSLPPTFLPLRPCCFLTCCYQHVSCVLVSSLSFREKFMS